MRFTRLLIILMVALPLLAACSPPPDLNSFINKAAKPYRLDIVKWEIVAAFSEAGKVLSGRHVSASLLASDVADFLSDPVEKSEEAPAVERQVERQVREAFSAHGIYGPLDRATRMQIGFPPVNIHLARPPHLLVVSPRDRIESSMEITLLPDMAEDDMVKLEDEIDRRGVSSLVVELGGLSTYPSFVTYQADIRFILTTAAEEWLHQYLVFTPLGFRYVLDLTGIRPDYEIATINETVAGIVSKEIGGWIYEKYYAADGEETVGAKAGGFDFNDEMREIRRSVDGYLEREEIEQAEKFMQEKRQYLEDNGYRIRKLNQAYFAFHGTYGDSPTSISPIGEDLRTLREQSATLRDFLRQAAAITGRKQLEELVRGQ